MKQLFGDCRTDAEKSNFFLSGRAVETGIIAAAISNDVAMAYHRCDEFKKELDALRAKIEMAENDAAHQKALAESALRVAEGWEKKCDELRIENEALRAEVIHIKEVEFPRKAQAVADGWRGKLEAAEKERDALRSLVVMRFDHDHPPQFVQGYDPHELNEPVTAEHCRWFVAEIEQLRAKIEAMEKQEPVAWMLNCQTLGGDTGWILSWTQSGAGLCNRLQGEENEKRLYAIPGAQTQGEIENG